MPVSLGTINIRKYGPLQKDLAMKLGRLNLIFGHNEQGKTLIVEFLVRSLFEGTSGWYLRENPLNGRISIDGLPDKHVFTPDTSIKLDSLLLDQDNALPQNFARLLVVKGAELAFIQGKKNGINRSILKEYLSGTGILDSIEGRISQTLKSTSIEQTQLIGPKRGEIKRIEELETSLKNIDGLLQQLDEQFSEGGRAQIRENIEELEQEQKKLDQSKRYSAYKLAQHIHRKKERLSQIPDTAVLDLSNRITEYHSLLSRFTDNQEKVAKLESNVKNTQWLRSAILLLETLPQARKSSPDRFFLAASGAALISSVVFIFIDTPPAVLASILVAVFFAALYIIRLQKSAAAAVQQDQYQNILQEFRRRFPEEKTDLASMKTALEILQADYYNYEQLTNQISQQQLSLETQRQLVESLFSNHQIDTLKPQEWKNQLEGLKGLRSNLINDIHSLELELTALQIDPQDYISEDPGTVFSLEEWERNISEIEKLEFENQQAEASLQSLKQLLCAQTQDDISTPWDQIIQNLQKIRQDTVDEYKKCYSYAAGKIILLDTLNKLRIHEDEKIQEALMDPGILAPLWKITGKYDNLELIEDQLFISGPHDRFKLSDLSSGAQEQVLLAMRLGIASRLFAGQPAFFILDDAFQHADWQRRVSLIEETIRIVKSGWQILYFTMDDHIRELFTIRGKNTLDEDFRLFELGDS